MTAVGGLRLDEPEVYCLLSDRAQAAMARAALFCANRTRDGVVTAAELEALRVKPAARKELIQHGFWREHESDSIEIVDYLKSNPSRAQVESERALAQRRAALRADPAIMRHVKARDEGKCRYCATAVDWADRRGRLGGTYDHVIPIPLGGTDSIDNIVTACRRCNSVKGGRTPEQAGLRLLPVSQPDSNTHLPVDGTGSKPVDATGVSPNPPSPPSGSESSLTPDPQSSSVLASDLKDLPGSARARRSKPKAKQESEFPDDFAPTKTELKLADDLGLTEYRERAQFKDTSLAKGWTAKDWLAKYRTWLRKSAEFKAGSTRAPGAVEHAERQPLPPARTLFRDEPEVPASERLGPEEILARSPRRASG